MELLAWNRRDIWSLIARNGIRTKRNSGFEQYKNYPSILFIDVKFIRKKFSFQPFSKSKIKKEILNLDNSDVRNQIY